MIGLTICSMTMVGWAAPAKKKAPIKWPEAIHWVSFGEGQMQAATLGKPMLVLVYANWCTQCHALAKALADPKVVNATRPFVMVLADHDDDSQGLTYYTPKLSYVPRIFFMRPNGEFWPEMQSGNTRYPYYYDANNLTNLLNNMEKSLAHHSEKP